MTEHSNVYEAMLAVMKEVGYVKRDGQMTYGEKYTYPSEQAFIQALRPAMIEHGLVIVPSTIDNCFTDTYETKRGGEMNLVTITRNYYIIHAASGTSVSVGAGGQGADNGDKAMGKAQTNSLKYVLRNSFLIETGDDPDDTSSATQERKGKKESEKKLFIDWDNLQEPSDNFTDDERKAWRFKITKLYNDGTPLARAVMLADEAYYDYKKDN